MVKINSSYRYPTEVGFFDTVNLSEEDRVFLKNRREFFNYLVESIEQTSQKINEVQAEVDKIMRVLQNKGSG